MKPAAFFDEVVASVPLEPSLGLRVTLWIIALAPLFTIRRLATIASLEPEARQRVLDRLLASRVYAVRQLVAGFKAMGVFALRAVAGDPRPDERPRRQGARRPARRRVARARAGEREERSRFP